jgi:hypothetical protein
VLRYSIAEVRQPDKGEQGRITGAP